MPDSETTPGRDLPGEEVLTLAETAAYLRVPEPAILELVAKKALPAQQVGGEWRFLKRAVVEWLRFGPHPCHECRMFPFWEELFQALESRILGRVLTPERPSAKLGSKQAVLKHFGVFQDDADVEEELAGIRARREAAEE
ncbi:MAG: helix-turn-helix domain-containing protein [Gemmataceae bacterium]|nr:helix-turn-helix domain-containing protein [Gemmataceae bacterium]